MRFLFIAPLSAKRHCRGISSLASILNELGHDCHAVVREVTRVRYKDAYVLSRNERYVEDLRMSLGPNGCSKLHSHLTTNAHASETILLETDIARISALSVGFAPDAVIHCIDDLVSENDAILAASPKPAKSQRLFRLINSEGSGNVLVDVETNTCMPAKLDSPQELKRLLLDNVLRPLNSERSHANLRAVLNAHAQLLEQLASESLTPERKAAEGVKGTSATLSGTAGEVESVKDGDVIFGDTLWIKGWIDFSSVEAKCLLVQVNDTLHRVYPGSVRGELAVQRKNHNILGFDARVPITQEGARLAVKIKLLSKDGLEHGWKKFFVWSNNSVPAKYRTPVLTGQATVTDISEARAVEGAIGTDGYALRAVRALQAGAVVGIVAFEPSRSAVREPFCITLSGAYDESAPLHLWVDLEEDQSVYWMRTGRTDGGTAVLSLLNGDPEGHVVHDGSINVGLAAGTGGGLVQAYVNGVAAVELDTRDGFQSVALPIEKHGNSLCLELRGADGSVARRQLWRHLDEPLTRATLSAITIQQPGYSIGGLRNQPAVNRRTILVIRKAAAPTDELYILAPLRRLARHHRLDIQIVDTDNEARTDAERERVLLPGTVVVVSRYITDEWIVKLTAKAHTLGHIVYLMDDDVASAEDAKWLPGGYRDRMMRVAHGEFQTMVNLCDRFIVTCDFLARRFASPKTDLLEPPYLHPPKHLDHLDDKSSIVIAYHGTLVHRDDVAAVAPALRQLHDKYPQVRIQIVMGSYVPSALKGLSRVEIVPAMPWEDYKRFIDKTRAHIAIAPILETPYNLGKSVIKIMDIAALGAVGVYTRSEPYTKYIDNGVNGFLVENDPLMWQKTLAWLVERPDEIRRMAQNAQDLAGRIGAMSILEDYWCDTLSLPRK